LRYSITSSAREKMLNIPEDAHFNNMSTFGRMMTSTSLFEAGLNCAAGHLPV
jgi:hypothetical protein